MVEAVNVLENIRDMDKRGLLTVSPEVRTVRIVAEDAYEHEVELYFAELGTELPDSATQPLDKNWAPFDPGIIAAEDMSGCGAY